MCQGVANLRYLRRDSRVSLPLPWRKSTRLPARSAHRVISAISEEELESVFELSFSLRGS